MSEILPLYTEAQAAAALGIKPRSLRTERLCGRIAYKTVAGKIMYRETDIATWLAEGERCQGGGRTKDRNSSGSKSEGGERPSGTSDGQRGAGAASVQRALASAARLKKPSVAGSSSATTSPELDKALGILLKFRSPT